MNPFFLLVSSGSLPNPPEASYDPEKERLIETIFGLSFTAILGGIIAYLFLRYVYFKIRKEFRFKTKFNPHNHVDALILLSMNVLRAHPDCFKEKCMYLKEYIYYLYPDTDSFHESLKMAYKDVYRSASIVNWLNQFLDEEQRRDVVRFLIHMAAQDGIIASRERAELVTIIDAFDLVRGEWLDLIEGINDDFAEKQRRWNERHQKTTERYVDSLVEKALVCFELGREALNEQQLRSRYRELVKLYHPDRHPDATPEEHKELEIKFQEIQLYYEELIKLIP